MSFKLPALPYAKNALEPHISQKTLEYHYDKHHNTYIINLNKLIKNTNFVNKSLEEVIKTDQGGIFNNATQVWNHTFYWHCLAPNVGGELKGKIAEEINQHFDKFKQQFTDTALKNFCSGWTWLVKKTNNKLSIVNTSNPATPLTDNDKPLLTVDIWEHAYYKLS